MHGKILIARELGSNICEIWDVFSKNEKWRGVLIEKILIECKRSFYV